MAVVQLRHRIGERRQGRGSQRVAAERRPLGIRCADAGDRRGGRKRRRAMTKVEIPTALRAFAGNKDAVELEGATVGELLRALGASFPQLKKHLFDDQGKLRNFVNVYVNDDDIKHLDKEATRVSAKDVISIIPSVAGGAAAGGAAGNGALSQQQIQRYSRHLI